ncbi:MAG: AAA family ATPase [Pseudomonadota bacterium]
MKTDDALFVTRIEVRKLFGLYDYVLEKTTSGEDPGRVAILYGDNGSGKTTILRSVFHLLAPDESSGHKTAIARTPLSMLSVTLSDGSEIRVERPKEELLGGFQLTIRRKRAKPDSFSFPVDQEMSVSPKSETKEEREEITRCLRNLKEFNLGLYHLADDRTIELAGSAVPNAVEHQMEIGMDSEEEVIISRTGRPPQFVRRIPKRPGEIAANLLEQSMNRFALWVKNLALRASSAGDSSVNTLYAEILARLARAPVTDAKSPPLDKNQLRVRIEAIQSRSQALARYGLVPEFSGQQILQQLRAATKSDTVSVMAHVLAPYIESLERRLDALTHTFEIVDNLVGIVNGFLSHKQVVFHVHEGLSILTDKAKSLSPYNLSSGERHLLLIFCNTSVAIEHPSIFMVDEPEISLNIKWQRSLISSLCKCIGTNPVQYILATHSLEIISQYRDRVLRLTPIEE